MGSYRSVAFGLRDGEEKESRKIMRLEAATSSGCSVSPLESELIPTGFREVFP